MPQKDENDISPYPLPLVGAIGMSLRQAIPGIIMGLAFPWAILIPMDSEPILPWLLVRVFMPVMGVFLLSIAVIMLTPNKLFFMVDKLEFRRKTLFGEKRYHWTEIADVVVMSVSSSVVIGLVGNDELERQKKNNLYGIYRRGLRPNAVVASLPVNLMKGLNPDRVFLTIANIIHKNESPDAIDCRVQTSAQE